jgi:cytochrome b subunit of formate dehydrogenase
VRNAWTYIIANCAIAVLGVLINVQWPNVVGPTEAPLIVVLLAAANAAAHAVAGPGPASSKGK